MNKKTYGQTLIDHEAKLLDMEDDLIEYRKLMEPDIMAEIRNTAEKARNQTLYANRDFYIVVMMVIEKIGGIPRTRIFARRSCPTPVYKQSVWKYCAGSSTLEFIWSIPDQILYYYMWHNRHKLFDNKEVSDLLKFVVLMETGEMLNWVKKENGEKIDAVIKTN